MEIKTCNPLKVLTYSTNTTFIEMIEFVGKKARELSLEALNSGMEITGPVYWIYDGADGNPNTKFKLDICLPVHSTSQYKGNFELKQTSPFKCISAIHNGAWNEMGPLYNQMHETLQSKQHFPTGICREIYMNVDFDNPSFNITEIQVGIN
jgi:effector-binding domain-containing protein